MTDEELSELSILKELVKQHGDDLIEEVAWIVYENGQGDCYGCLCNKYCIENTCFNAIKMTVKDMLEIKEGEHGNN